MRHFKKRRILSREKTQRDALLSGLASSLFLNKRIATTLAKAKEVKPFAEKLITKAKINSPARIRLVNKKLSKQASKELFGVIAPICLKRKGGYVRIIRKSFRKSDGASMALVELVDSFEEKDSKKDLAQSKKGKNGKNAPAKKTDVKDIKKKQDAKKQNETKESNVQIVKNAA
ncbi:MAG: 50S ribosomal protein L17 [Patescibacteria group bacterium]|nr:50S ribosomal protein L17 [Patescibacteria group bacterium]